MANQYSSPLKPAGCHQCAHVQRAAIAVTVMLKLSRPSPGAFMPNSSASCRSGFSVMTFQPSIRRRAPCRAPGGRRSPRCRSCRPCGRGCATEYWRRNSLLRPQLLHRLPQGLAGGGGVQRTTGLFRIVTVAGAPAGPRRRIVAPVGGIDHLLFALQRGGDRLIKVCSRCGSGPAAAGRRRADRASAPDQRAGDRRRHRGDQADEPHRNQPRRQRIGISQRRLPLRAIKRLNIS